MPLFICKHKNLEDEKAILVQRSGKMPIKSNVAFFASRLRFLYSFYLYKSANKVVKCRHQSKCVDIFITIFM